MPEELPLARFFLELRNHPLELGGELPGLEACERVGQGAVVAQRRLLRDVRPLPYSLTYGAVISQDRAGVMEFVGEHDQACRSRRLGEVLEVALPCARAAWRACRRPMASLITLLILDLQYMDHKISRVILDTPTIRSYDLPMIEGPWRRRTACHREPA